MKAKPPSYYDAEYFDTDGDKGYPGPYTLASAPWSRLAMAMVRTFGPTIGVTTVTEFGCARGFVLFFLQHMGWKVKGYDFSKFAVETALPGIDIEIADLTKRSEYEPADLVVCMDVLEHVAKADLPFALKNIRRTMGKAAVVQVYIPGSNVRLAREPEDHVTNEPREWWLELFAKNGLRLHHLQPTYELFLRRKVPAVFADMWIASSFVLEAIPGWRDSKDIVELIDERIVADAPKVAKVVSKTVARRKADETDTPESVDGNVAKKPERWAIPDLREAAEQAILPSPD